MLTDAQDALAGRLQREGRAVTTDAEVDVIDRLRAEAAILVSALGTPSSGGRCDGSMGDGRSRRWRITFEHLGDRTVYDYAFDYPVPPGRDVQVREALRCVGVGEPSPVIAQGRTLTQVLAARSYRVIAVIESDPA